MSQDMISRPRMWLAHPHHGAALGTVEAIMALTVIEAMHAPLLLRDLGETVQT